MFRGDISGRSVRGAVPDGLSGTPPQYGTPLNITFNVAAMHTPLTSVSVNMAMIHSWIGDLDALLIAPDGVSAQVFGRVGVTTAAGFGDESNFAGTYNFGSFATNGRTGLFC
jgi:hypothetical protein